MKKIIYLSYFLFASHIICAQDEPKKFKFPINEYNVSLNMTPVVSMEYPPNTDLEIKNIDSRFGFGLGAYRSGSSARRLNFIAGIEFNHSRQYRRIHPLVGDYLVMYKVDYSLSCFSLPLGVRVNMGKKVRYFIEFGGYFDFLTASRRKGILFKVLGPVGPHSEKYVSDNAYMGKFNVGPYGGFGAIFPHRGKVEFVVKADCKIGAINIHPYKDDYNYENDGKDRIYNRYVRLSVGMKF